MRVWSEVARAPAIPLVATNDCHFHRREDVFAHRVLIGIGQNQNLDELSRDYAYNDEFYVKSPAEMCAPLRRLSRGLRAHGRDRAAAATCSFAERELHLPQLPGAGRQLPEQPTWRSWRGTGWSARLARTASRAATPDEAYRSRLENELAIIDAMGFPGYFLVVWDFIRHAREQGIPVGPGRGSAAGSLVSYALGITDIDPLEYDLLFERFLNPERISMPDIDIDFCQRRRDEVIALRPRASTARRTSARSPPSTSSRRARRCATSAGSWACRSATSTASPSWCRRTSASRSSGRSRTRRGCKELADGDEDVRRLLERRPASRGWPGTAACTPPGS